MTPPATPHLLASPIDEAAPRHEVAPVSAGRQYEVKSLGLAARCFDIAVILLLMPVILLIGGLIAVIIFVDSPGPVFYRCVRVGQGGRRFEMLKFRKMTRHATGGMLTVANDERFTPIGRFLAVTKLDELPQLWNVLKGEMRLVGPRPEVESFVARYPEPYREILTVVPGITGPAAIAFANESRLFVDREDPTAFYCDELLPNKIEIDLEYIRTRTLGRDIALLLATTTTPFVRVAHRLAQASSEGRRPYRFVGWSALALAVTVTFALSVASPV